MSEWVFDSVALIDWYCNRRGVFPYVEQILSGESEGAFSTISELELWQGLRPNEEEKHDALLSHLNRIPLDTSIARVAGKLRQRVGLDKLSLPDAAIAATAFLSGRTLLTRNTNDFSVLRGKMAIEFYENDRPVTSGIKPSRSPRRL